MASADQRPRHSRTPPLHNNGPLGAYFLSSPTRPVRQMQAGPGMVPLETVPTTATKRVTAVIKVRWSKAETKLEWPPDPFDS